MSMSGNSYISDLHQQHNSSVAEGKAISAYQLSAELLGIDPCLNHYHRHIRSQLIDRTHWIGALETICDCVKHHGIDRVVLENIKELTANELEVFDVARLREAILDMLHQIHLNGSMAQVSYMVIAALGSESLQQLEISMPSDIETDPVAAFYCGRIKAILSGDSLQPLNPETYQAIVKACFAGNSYNIQILLEHLLRAEASNVDVMPVAWYWANESAGLLAVRRYFESGYHFYERSTTEILRFAKQYNLFDVYIGLVLWVLVRSFDLPTPRERNKFLSKHGITLSMCRHHMLLYKYIHMSSSRHLQQYIDSIVEASKFGAIANDATAPHGVREYASHMYKSLEARHSHVQDRIGENARNDAINVYLFGQIRQSSLGKIYENISTAKACPNVSEVRVVTWDNFPASQIPKTYNEFKRLVPIGHQQDIEVLMKSRDYQLNADLIAALMAKKSKSNEAVLQEISDLLGSSSVIVQREEIADLEVKSMQAILDEFQRRFGFTMMEVELKIISNQYKMLTLMRKSILDFLEEPSRFGGNLLLARNEIGSMAKLLSFVNQYSYLVSSGEYDAIIDTEWNSHTIPPYGGVGDRFIFINPSAAKRLADHIPFSVQEFTSQFDAYLPNDHEMLLHHRYLHDVLAKGGFSVHFVSTMVCDGLDRGSELLDAESLNELKSILIK